MNKGICFLLAMLMCSALFARSNDPVFPQNSLRVEIGGKAILGAGITFERAWRNQNKTKYPRAFNSVDANVSYMYPDYIVTSVGINQNWYVGARKKWTISCGIALAGLICLDPTPKEVRAYYDSIQFYGGNYTNPIEPWLLGNVSCRYTFHKLFVQASVLPILYYDRAYNRGLGYGTWSGASVGINLKKDE
jgi:hypothetical protein